MANALRIGVIGCGYRSAEHVRGYQKLGDKVELVACTDIDATAAERFAKWFNFKNFYTDYMEMLAREKLDIVCACVWPELHCKVVLDIANCPHPPKLLDAEKPIAVTCGDARKMVNVCRDKEIMLTICHQRRYVSGWHAAKELIAKGGIGTLQQMELNTADMMDWGTHWFDMMEYYNNELEPSWLFGQVGCSMDHTVYGVQMDTAGMVCIKWPNDVSAFMTTGRCKVDSYTIRLLGSEGLLDVRSNKVELKRYDGKAVTFNYPDDEKYATYLYVEAIVNCLLDGTESISSGKIALLADEMVFATYESARKHERVFFPTKITGNPLLTMLKSGELKIPSWPAFLTEEDEANGFKLAFDGKSLAGMNVTPPRSWSHAGGLLTGKTPDSIIWLREYVEDFELKFEWRPGCRAAMDVVFWAEPGSEQRGLPILMVYNPLAQPGLDTVGALGGIVPSTKGVFNFSSWHTCSIRCEKGILTINEFGQEVQKCDLTKIKDFENIEMCGRIGFRMRKGTISIKNIRIREL